MHHFWHYTYCMSGFSFRWVNLPKQYYYNNSYNRSSHHHVVITKLKIIKLEFASVRVLKTIITFYKCWHILLNSVSKIIYCSNAFKTQLQLRLSLTVIFLNNFCILLLRFMNNEPVSWFFIWCKLSWNRWLFVSLKASNWYFDVISRNL